MPRMATSLPPSRPISASGWRARHARSCPARCSNGSITPAARPGWRATRPSRDAHRPIIMIRCLGCSLARAMHARHVRYAEIWRCCPEARWSISKIADAERSAPRAVLDCGRREKLLALDPLRSDGGHCDIRSWLRQVHFIRRNLRDKQSCRPALAFSRRAPRERKPAATDQLYH